MLRVAQSKFRLASHVRGRLTVARLSIRGFAASNNDNDGNDNNTNNNKKKKLNFDRQILQPAQRGHLPGKHGSAIPKLAARKGKAHLTPVTGRAGHRGPPQWTGGGDEWNNMDEDESDLVASAFGGRRRRGEGEDGPSAREKSLQYVMDDYDPYFAFELMDDKKYYWREEEFEDLVDDLDEEEALLLHPDTEDLFEIEYTKSDLKRHALLNDSLAADVDFASQRRRGQEDNLPRLLDGNDAAEPTEETMTTTTTTGDRRQDRYTGMDPEEWFFQGSSNILETLDRNDLMDTPDSFGPPAALRKQIMELNPHHGSDIDGFLQAMAEHPTDIARVTHLKKHPGTQREPKPDFPKNRQPHPPLEFVEGHSRFLYVTGLPPLVVNGEEGDLENPVHRSFLEKLVGRLVNVDSMQVWPVNRTSAFVGFFTPRALADALKAGPSEKVLSQLPHVALLSNEDKNPFADTEADRVVQLNQIPAGHTPTSLVRTLFPPDSELETVYGKSLDATQDVYFLSSTKVLLRFSSAEEAAAAVDSRLWMDRLADVGLYPVRYFRARRELVHAGFTGHVKDEEVRVMGPRLIVDGDMPSREFFQSHPRCIQVRNLDPVQTTAQMLTELFQPYSELPRQTASIEFVKCEAGSPTDRAYIGFDLPGEAEACIKACKGLLRVGDRRLILRLVDDRVVPHRPLYRAEKRPARPVEDLWDDLNNWEKYVDPADIEYLEQNGVSKVIIDEALRKIRRSNPTFGPLDNALRSEALEPDTSPGGLYKEFVQIYVQTLKECVATPENVGEMYEALHMPDEPIDLSIFNDWEKKKAEIEKSRARP